MASIVLIGSDRIGLARLRDTLIRVGHQVETATELSDAGILIRAVSADILIIDVDEALTRDLPLLEALVQQDPDLEVVLLLGPMPPPYERELIEITQAMGARVHLPRQLTHTPFFPSVMAVVADRRRLREANKKLEEDVRVLRAVQREQRLQEPLTPDYSYLRKRLRQELSRGSHVSLMIIGIDDFEALQQEHGRQVAEQLVQELANLLRSDLRDSDIVTRTRTMERLAVLLPLTEAVQTKAVASRIQAKMARRSVDVGSVCAGIVEGNGGVDADELLRLADEAWEQARHTEEKLAVLT